MINLKRNERDAIEALDGQALRNAVEDVTTHRSMAALRRLELHRLGLYVTQTETRVLRALSELGKAKSAAKISRQKQGLSEAGWDLMSAVDEMRARAEQERRDAERFRIQDLIMDPSFRRPDMSVTVSYNWRLSGEDEWHYGSVRFRHRHVPAFDFIAASGRRRPSARQRAGPPALITRT